MMDRICCAVLEKICSLAPLGRYVVITGDEFFEALPQDVENTGQELKRAIKTLLSEGYIDVKYSSGNLYCAAPLKNYEKPPEPAEQVIETEKEEPAKDRTPIYMLLSAFCGGMAGSLLINLIFLLINA